MTPGNVIQILFFTQSKKPPNLLVMPVQRPFNDHTLWRGTLQRANYPLNPLKPSMILPKINNLVGGTIKDPSAPPIWEEVNQSYRNYSQSYWARVKGAHARYRIENENN